jgi:4-alpha-glucanotransferase
MNQPGIAEGNWQWRFREDMITRRARTPAAEHDHTLWPRAGRVPADAL